MKAKTHRVSTQIHTRKLDRLVAKKQMKSFGMCNICQRKGLRNDNRSAFANDWRNYTTYGSKILV